MTRLFSRVSLLLLTALLSGCDEEQFALRVNHYQHVTENEMDCDECHGELGTPSFNAITHETCVDCHDEVEAKEVNNKTCGYCHVKKDLAELADWKPESRPPQEKSFVHTEALAGKCTECHASVMQKDLALTPLIKRSEVVRLRDASHAQNQDCQQCHVDMDPAQKPDSHQIAWTKRHGLFGMQTDAACSVCHSEDSCKECHSIMAPVSHNNLWRRQTHGIVSTWNRQSCMVCHEQDSCVACHNEVRPRSHRANYRENHCVGCHLGSASPGADCTVCHEGGNSVLDHSEVWPSDHDQFGFQVDCLFCHPR